MGGRDEESFVLTPFADVAAWRHAHGCPARADDDVLPVMLWSAAALAASVVPVGLLVAAPALWAIGLVLAALCALAAGLAAAPRDAAQDEDDQSGPESGGRDGGGGCRRPRPPGPVCPVDWRAFDEAREAWERERLPQVAGPA